MDELSNSSRAVSAPVSPMDDAKAHQSQVVTVLDSERVAGGRGRKVAVLTGGKG